MASSMDTIPVRFDWQPQPQAAALVHAILTECCDDSPGLRRFAGILQDETGTRLADWIDHFALPALEDLEEDLERTGFVDSTDELPSVWQHPGATFPAIVLHETTSRRVAIRVESVADFLSAHRMHGAIIEGIPLAPMRKALVGSESGVEFWVVERHGHRGWEPCDRPCDGADAVRCHEESFRQRERLLGPEPERFEHAARLIRSAVSDMGAGRACDLFFAVERQYWTARNRAAQVQKARQDALGLGWGNHDHHTYRSSRAHFFRLIALLEALGLECRERFYAGSEAGWGAQVLEQPEAGIVVFADVDLGPDEVSGDVAHRPLQPAGSLGTVGLWCRLHGEAFLEAGMHHLECRFDFHAVRRQLLAAGIRTMKPFTDLPYLKQAFTDGETWPVDARRIEDALAAGLILGDEAGRFLRDGAIGSHLEILQRDEGYKGFNKTGINQIIALTDPRCSPATRT